jgi:hypothetical protein
VPSAAVAGNLSGSFLTAVSFHLPPLWADRAYGHTADPRPLRRLVLTLRIAAIAVSAVLVFVICRVLNALPWPVDAALALVSALWFAYRFERSA